MGRIPGVTGAETRERLLRAAADVFAEHGFDGTRVAAIAAAAGLSNGALYAHFASKADLLVDALRTHGRGRLADLFAAEPDLPVTVLLLLIGTGRNSTVKVQIDPERCQGHGRCYDIAPGLFGDDDEGYGKVLGDGVVPPGQDHEAGLAAANCPERAITLAEGS